MPAFSPDGKQIAFVRAENETVSFTIGQVGQANIYTKLIGAATELRLTDHSGTDYYPAWSPDGQYIAFYRREPGASGIYVVSAFGGHERRITNEAVESAGLTWLPDGKHLVTSYFSGGIPSSPLIEVSLDTGGQRPITLSAPGAAGDGWPVISPDRKKLAFLRFTSSNGVLACFMTLTSKRILRCWPLQVNWPEGLAWAGHGDAIIVSAIRDGGHRLWRYDNERATPIALTSGEVEATSPAVTPSGNLLTYVLSRLNTNLWELDVSQSQGTKATTAKLIATSTRFQIDPAFSADGRKIAFASDRSGSEEIWVTDRQTQTPVQLTHVGGPVQVRRPGLPTGRKSHSIPEMPVIPTSS
jgi:Tol biopolymer transport system component